MLQMFHNISEATYKFVSLSPTRNCLLFFYLFNPHKFFFASNVVDIFSVDSRHTNLCCFCSSHARAEQMCDEDVVDIQF